MAKRTTGRPGRLLRSRSSRATSDATDADSPTGQTSAEEKAAEKSQTWVRRHWILSAAILTAVAAITSTLLGLTGSLINNVKDAVTDDVQVQVETNQDKIQVNGLPAHAQYVIPKFRADLAPPPTEVAEGSCLVTYGWATGQDGVVANFQHVQVRLTGQTDDGAQLTSVEIVQPADQQHEPTSGSLPICGRGGPPSDVPILYVNLYRDPAKSTWRFEDASGGAANFDFELPDNVSKSILVIATAHDCECHWSLMATGSTQAGDLKVPINDSGRSFAVTSEQNADIVYRDGQQWKAPDPGSVIQIPPPPANIVLPDYDACSLLSASEWTKIASTATMLSNHPLNSRWTSGQRLPGRPDQAGTNCSFTQGASSAIQIQLIVAVNLTDATAIATSIRTANQIAPWRQIAPNIVANGAGSVLVQHDSQLLSIDVPGNRSAAAWLPQAAQLYEQRLR